MRKVTWGTLALVLAATTALAAGKKKDVEPVKHIGIYVQPYYAAAEKPDGRPFVAVAKAYDAQLASNDPKDILAVRDAVTADPKFITPMTLMVLAIRLFDVGERDESVFWFYVARDRYFTLAGVLNVNTPQLAGVTEAVGGFARLAGDFINIYAFCDVTKQQDARLKAMAWVEANPYEVLFVEQLPALPGDRRKNLEKTLAAMKQRLAEEGKELEDPAERDYALRTRAETGVDARFCPGGKNALTPGPIDPSRPRGHNPFKVKDGKVAYFNLVGTKYPIPDADPKTFRHIGGFYGKDAHRVYHGNDVVVGAEPASFQFLGRQAGRDAKAVYIGDEACPTCDPATFRVLNDTDEYEVTNWYVDKNTVFEDNQAYPEIDPASFEPINTWFSRDRNKVYMSGRPVRGADPASFKLAACGECETCGEDKNRCYWFDNAVPCDCAAHTLADFPGGAPMGAPAAGMAMIGGREIKSGLPPDAQHSFGSVSLKPGAYTFGLDCWDSAARKLVDVPLSVTLAAGQYSIEPVEGKCEYRAVRKAIVIGQAGQREIWLWNPGQDGPVWNLELDPGKRTFKTICREVKRQGVDERSVDVTLDLEPGAVYQLAMKGGPKQCAVEAKKL